MSKFNPEAPIKLQFSNTEIELPLARASAFTYRGLARRAMSHIWLLNEIQPEDGRQMGVRIWFDQFGVNEDDRFAIFSQTLQAMNDCGYEMHLNLREPNESDLEAFVEFQSKEIDNYGWD